MFIKQLSVFVENKAGRLAEITAVLANAGIDIRALSIADTTNFGILRLIVNRPQQAEEILKKEGMTVSLTNVIAVSIPDTPGGFSQAMQSLAGAEISVEYMYAFLTPQEKDRACIIMRVEDNQGTLQLLQKSGVEVLNEEQVYSM